MLAGAVYADGDVRGVKVSLDATDSAAASNVSGVARTLRDRVRPELSETAPGDFGVERDGSTVTAAVERTVSELESLIDRDSAGY